jgi:hypothetical protein
MNKKMIRDIKAKYGVCCSVYGTPDDYLIDMKGFAIDNAAMASFAPVTSFVGDVLYYE